MNCRKNLVMIALAALVAGAAALVYAQNEAGISAGPERLEAAKPRSAIRP